AEDGIRGGHVTGVQTCALPICGVVPISAATASRTRAGGRATAAGAAVAVAVAVAVVAVVVAVAGCVGAGELIEPHAAQRREARRSEERRVGKEEGWERGGGMRK